MVCLGLPREFPSGWKTCQSSQNTSAVRGGAPLREVLRGSSLKWISGKKKKFTLSKEERKLQDARKASLYGRAAQSDYDQMVENVDTNLRAKNAAEAAAGATLKQASFGVHIIVGMIGGFAVGYMVSGNIGSGGLTIRYTGGLVGLVGTLILEVVLFITRAQRVEMVKKQKMR